MSIGHLEALARERGMICDPELQRLRDRYSDLVNMHREDLVFWGSGVIAATSKYFACAKLGIK